MWKWCIATHRICCCHSTFSKSEETINHFQVHLICWHGLLISELFLCWNWNILVSPGSPRARHPAGSWISCYSALKQRTMAWICVRPCGFLGSPKSWHSKFWTAWQSVLIIVCNGFCLTRGESNWKQNWKFSLGLKVADWVSCHSWIAIHKVRVFSEKRSPTDTISPWRYPIDFHVFFVGNLNEWWRFFPNG